MKNIALITGGNSSEYVISLKSAENVARALDSEKYRVFIVRIAEQSWTLQNEGLENIAIDRSNFSITLDHELIRFDLAYIVIHGTPGEDGILQAYFDLLGIPYTTGGVLNMSLTFNKYFCNNYLRGLGVQVAPSKLLRKGDSFDTEKIIEELQLPCFVKPNDAGSSFGVTKVKTPGEMPLAIAKAFEEGQEVVIERFLNGTEVTCGVLKTANQEIVLPITEIVSANEFFDFAAKYTPELVQEITPARISDKETASVQSIASQVYDLLNCKGIVRVDFIIENGIPYLLELNTIPGMSAASLVPKQLECAGISQSQVFDWVIQDALSK